MMAPPSSKQSERHVEAVLAALELLDCFMREPSLSIKQLVEMTGFTRNRVTRLTGTLRHREYLGIDPATGAFCIGPRIFSLSRVFERSEGLISLVRPVLRRLALETGESVSLYVRRGFKRVVLAREEGTQAVRYLVTEGQQMDLHAGAGGKVLLAYAPPEVLEATLNSLRPPDQGFHPSIQRRALEEEFALIRMQGYALSKGERNPDVCAIAVPLLNAAEELVGALGVAVPVSRFTSGAQEGFIQVMLNAGCEISRKLGWENRDGKKV